MERCHLASRKRRTGPIQLIAMRFQILCVFIVISGLFPGDGAVQYDYTDTSLWCDFAPGCCPTNTRQSPIDIATGSAIEEEFGPIMHSMGTLSPTTGKLVNNGHTLQFNLPEADIAKKDKVISGGPLKGESYQLAQFHFHWGRTQTTGSEHSLDGKFFPAEVHLVHFNAKFDDLGSALGSGEQDPDALAVIGMFIEVEEAKSEAFMPIVEKTSEIRMPNSEAEVTIDLAKIYSMLADPMKFTTYPGSLTTPGCNEIVTWINMLDPIKIGRTDLKFIRLIRETSDKARLVNNYREIQTNANPLKINAV